MDPLHVGHFSSSPRTRGYFLFFYLYGVSHALFPAHAGVFPSGRGFVAMSVTLPRARGGISAVGHACQILIPSSPRTRGYFRQVNTRTALTELFPAHAGVFPCRATRRDSVASLPRARGGISDVSRGPVTCFLSSPRTRGYFRKRIVPVMIGSLFPAHAGVFPRAGQSCQDHAPLPRARGGISVYVTNRVPTGNSSPRTRGYFRCDAHSGQC